MSNVATQGNATTVEYHVIATMQPPGNQTGNEPVRILSCFKSCPSDIHESENLKLTTLNGDTAIPRLTIKTPSLEERLVRDEETNELYLPITSTVVLKRMQECASAFYLTVDALVDSGAYVSAIAQNDLDTK